MKPIAVWSVAVVAAVLVATAAAAPPPVHATSWLVENGATGEVLVSHDAQKRVPMASITKLMTVLVTLEHAKLSDVVTVSPQAAVVGESTIDLRPGERISVGDLVEAALIQSANDAATALAAYVGGGSIPRFVGYMNAKARALGLAHTHFANPSGLDAPHHFSSARDVTRLAQVLMQRAYVRSIVRRQTASIEGGRTLHTWNDLLAASPAVIGVKTGHTNLAGWSEVAAAREPGVTIYATILGGPSRAQRNQDLSELLSWGLSRYRLVNAVDASRTYATVATDYGRPSVRLVAPRSKLRVVRLGRPFVERVVAPTAVPLPVRKGERLGQVRVSEAGKLVASSPLVADRSVTAPGLGGKIRWYAGRTAHHLWEALTP